MADRSKLAELLQVLLVLLEVGHLGSVHSLLHELATPFKLLSLDPRSRPGSHESRIVTRQIVPTFDTSCLEARQFLLRVCDALRVTHHQILH